jgi:hypothetical protein
MHYLFTDASMVGCGAVLITADQQVYVWGRRWEKAYNSRDIDFLEARTISEASAIFKETISALDGSLMVLVDNTSSQFGLIKGIAKSESVNEALTAAIQNVAVWANKKQIIVRYVASQSNIADAISRGQDLDLDVTRVVVDDLRRGALGGGDAVRYFA